MRIYLMLILVVVFSSCVRNKKGEAVQNNLPANTNVFEVAEVIQGNTYTYLKVNENMQEKWVATAKTEANKGDVLYYDEALQMTNFHSRELDRTFDVIYFVNQVRNTPLAQNPMGNKPPHSGSVQTDKKSSVSLNKKENETTIAEIFANPDEFAGKETEIRGIVVKVNNGIMGKNWIHIQDGTNSGDNYDLTITSQNLIQVNDEVVFKGVININKDFGSGYFYEVIMEEAKLINNPATNDVM